MRTFVALDLDESIRRGIGEVQARLKARLPKVRWVRPDAVHLTVKFLGEIDADRAAQARETLESVSGATAPMAVRIGGCGAFPPRGPVRVVWIGVHDEGGALVRFQGRCEEALAEIGFPMERRPFSPHLTLARCNDPKAARRIRETLAGAGPHAGTIGDQVFAHVTFYRSVLGPQGSTYEVISRHPFAAGAGW